MEEKYPENNGDTSKKYITLEMCHFIWNQSNSSLYVTTYIKHDLSNDRSELGPEY